MLPPTSTCASATPRKCARICRGECAILPKVVRLGPGDLGWRPIARCSCCRRRVVRGVRALRCHTRRMPVLVIGAGSAGLAVSRGLGVRGIDHVVLERARVGQAWRDRWDSFKLVTPNWTLSLPGSPYGGDDPEGHVARDDIVAYLERYQERWAVPVREGVEVHRLSAGTAKRFCVTTSHGAIDADAVVVCTGTFQRPYHAAAWRFADGVPVLDVVSVQPPAARVPAGRRAELRVRGRPRTARFGTVASTAWTSASSTATAVTSSALDSAAATSRSASL